MKIILLVAATVDGKIAKHSGHLANWTSKADKKMFVEETKKVGVIVMGKATYDTISKPLPGRLNMVMTRNPDAAKNIPGILEYTNKAPTEIVKDLESRGFTSAVLGGGAAVNGMFLKENLIEEIWLTIEPKIFGEGVPIFSGAEADVDLKLLEVKKLDENVAQVKYKIIKKMDATNGLARSFDRVSAH